MPRKASTNMTTHSRKKLTEAQKRVRRMPTPAGLAVAPGDDFRYEGFTSLQSKFIFYMAQGLNQTDAARLAGYKLPRDSGFENMQIEKVRQAVYNVWRENGIALGPLIQQTLVGIMMDEQEKASDRISAASKLAQLVGANAPTQHQVNVNKTEMTPEEINARLEAINLQLSALEGPKKRDVEGEVEDADFAEVVND